MKLIQSLSELNAWQNERISSGFSIGFVPTMGALHSGHMALVRTAAVENDLVVCSIFVNPTQFNNREDLEKYPRTLNEDIQKLSEVKNVVVFAPTEDVIYPNEDSKKAPNVNLGCIGEVMEAKERPGHFEGVLTVVKRLFELVEPQKAYFGIKDFQQLLVVSKLAEQYFPQLQIVPCEIERAESGLALSSRNMRLSPNGLEKAGQVNRWLEQLVGLVVKDISDKLFELTTTINSDSDFKLEYLEVYNENDLSDKLSDSQPKRAFIAVWLENVRLIDNMRL